MPEQAPTSRTSTPLADGAGGVASTTRERVDRPTETVVHVDGVLTVANRRELQQRVIEALEKGARTVLVDLRETGYVDSAALGTLVMLAKQLLARGAELQLANVNEDLRAVLRLTRLDTVFSVVS